MVSGAIACQDLAAAKPAIVAKVVRILRQHPDFESRWKSKLDDVGDSEKNTLLFALAARWPDDVRGTPQSRDNWHYIDNPFKTTWSRVKVRPPA